jgi:primosomal protein N'
MKVICPHCEHEYELRGQARFFLVECVRSEQPGDIGTDCPRCRKSWFIDALTEGRKLLEEEMNR